ncbi:MAG: hypothetical protein KC635_03825, partial [Myxococcales bacterium]|nr:hypothetical protein [Myxococcales bacterium]
GGGGGRIALLAATAIQGTLGGTSPWSAFDASGALGYGSQWAGAGTFFRKVGSAKGDLVVDNEGHDAPAGSTPLPFQGSGTSSALTATSLTDAFTDFTPNGSLAGYLLNPNTAQGTTTLTDDVVFPLEANQETVLTVAAGANMLAVAGQGNPYSAFYVFDNLEIRGRGKVAADAEVLVLSGDVKSGNATTFGLEGQLAVRVLDLNGANTIAMAAGTGAGITVTGALINGDDDRYPFIVDLQDGFITKDAISVSTLVTNGGAISGTTLEIAGTFNAGSAVITFDRLTAPAGTDMNLVGGTWYLGEIDAPGDVTLSDAAAVEIRGNTVSVGGTLTLEDVHTTLSHARMANDDVVRKLEIRADAVSLGAGTLVNADGRGYLGG